MLGGQELDHRRMGVSPLTKASGRLETSSRLAVWRQADNFLADKTLKAGPMK
jgi:hypothetical protein